MAKVTAWLVTVIGALLVLGLVPGMMFNWNTMWVQWIIALLVLVIGISKLMRNYSKKKRR
jgi:hypothetical protein